MLFFIEEHCQAADDFFPLCQEVVTLALVFVKGTAVVEHAKNDHRRGDSQTNCRIDHRPHGHPFP